jgi:LEA14-like dessication related protein
MAQMIKTIGLTLLLVITTLLSGCSTWVSSRFQDPQVQLLSVEVVRAKLVEQEFLLKIRIDNPNSVSLPVRSLNYSVTLDNVLLAQGESREWFNVPAHGRHTFELPVQTNLWRHMRRVIKMLEKPESPIAYTFTGSVQTGVLFGRSVHISRNGEIIPGHFIPE